MLRLSIFHDADMVEATWLFPQHAGLLVAVDVVEFWLVFSSALFLFMSYLPPRIALGQVAARGYTKGLAMGKASGHAACSLFVGSVWAKIIVVILHVKLGFNPRVTASLLEIQCSNGKGVGTNRVAVCRLLPYQVGHCQFLLFLILHLSLQRSCRADRRRYV